MITIKKITFVLAPCFLSMVLISSAYSNKNMENKDSGIFNGGTVFIESKKPSLKFLDFQPEVTADAKQLVLRGI